MNEEVKIENVNEANKNDNNNINNIINKKLNNKITTGKTVSIDNNNKNINSKNNNNDIVKGTDKGQEKGKHTMVISPQLKLIEIKSAAAPFLFKLINENRRVMSEHIPYFQRIHSINDVVEFIKKRTIKIVETDYIYAIINSKEKTYNNYNKNKNNVEEDTIEKSFLYFITYEKVPIGVIGLLNIDWFNRQGELHFWIGVRFQKRGLMNQALPRMLNFLFYDVRLNRIIVKIRPNNNPGKMILKKYEFMLEGIERQSFYYITENDSSKNSDKVDKLKPPTTRHRHHNRSGRGNENNGVFYDLFVYSLISRDYV